MFRKLFCFICLVLFNTNVQAVTFEQYIVDHESDEMRAYLTGYADAVHNNSYLLGGCPRKLTYRPYGEYFQHIDIYISKKTKDKSVNLNAFYQEPVEPLLTAVILKYTNCNNPESRKLTNEPKRVQIEMRNLARNIMQQTQKYQTPEEREKDFMYKEYIDRLDNPKKYEKSCPKCNTTSKTPQQKSIPKPPSRQPEPKSIPVQERSEKPVPQPPLEQPKTNTKEGKNHWYNPLRKKETLPTPLQGDVKTDGQAPQTETGVSNQKVNTETKVETKQDVTTTQIVTDPVVVINRPLIDPKSQPPILQPQVIGLENKPAEPEKPAIKGDAKPQIEQRPDMQIPPVPTPPKPEPIKEKPLQPINGTYTSDDPFTMPEIEIPAQIVKKNVKEVDITDVQAKKYELESLDINLDNIQNVTLPSL